MESIICDIIRVVVWGIYGIIWLIADKNEIKLPKICHKLAFYSALFTFVITLAADVAQCI